jgi:hypothetical protein
LNQDRLCACVGDLSLVVKPSPWSPSKEALKEIIPWVRALKFTRDSGPIGRKFLQIKTGTQTTPRKLKAHHGVVSITTGLMSIVSAWMNSDGHVLQPEFASYVGKYTTVVREIVSRTIDIDVSINTYSLLTPRSGRLEPFGGHSPDVRTFLYGCCSCSCASDWINGSGRQDTRRTNVPVARNFSIQAILISVLGVRFSIIKLAWTP